MKFEERRNIMDKWDEWMDTLAANDYLVVDNFIDDRMYDAIQRHFMFCYNEQEFSKAAIGTATTKQVEASIRGDFIYWLDPHKDRQLSELFGLLDELVNQLRQHLYLGISDYEFHFAMYPAGTRYEKHIDQFHGKSNRLISVLIYLNEDWKPGDGGELKIYREDGNDLLIEPIAKRLLMFRSDTVEHEVMVTHVPRKSLTGWLLRQPAGLGYLV